LVCLGEEFFTPPMKSSSPLGAEFFTGEDVFTGEEFFTPFLTGCGFPATHVTMYWLTQPGVR